MQKNYMTLLFALAFCLLGREGYSQEVASYGSSSAFGASTESEEASGGESYSPTESWESSVGSGYVTHPPATATPKITASNIPDASNLCDTTNSCYSTGSSDLGTNVYYYAANTTPSPYIGGRSTPGSAIGALDVWGSCRYVDNTGSDSYFVPFHTAAEWQSFITNGPLHSKISLAACARQTPLTVLVQGNSQCEKKSFTTALPYARLHTTLDRTEYLLCNIVCWTNSITKNTQCGTNTVNTATMRFTVPGPVKNDVLSWSEKTTYTNANLPACDPRPTTTTALTACNAACGRPGTFTVKYTDGCNQSVTKTAACNGPACPVYGGGSSSSSSGGAGGYSGNGTVSTQYSGNLGYSGGTVTGSSEGGGGGGGGSP